MNLLLYQLPNITILPLQEMLWLFPSLFAINNFLPKTRKTFLVHKLLPESFFVFSKIQNLQSVFKPLNARFYYEISFFKINGFVNKIMH